MRLRGRHFQVTAQRLAGEPIPSRSSLSPRRYTLVWPENCATEAYREAGAQYLSPTSASGSMQHRWFRVYPSSEWRQDAVNGRHAPHWARRGTVCM